MGATVAQVLPEQLIQKTSEALQALAARGVQIKNCPLCNQNAWRADLIAYFVSALPVSGLAAPPPHIPTLTLTCNFCVNTVVHNFNVLGISL